MTEINLNIEEYLTEEDKEEIVREEYRRAVRNYMDTERDYKRIITNATYQLLFDEIDKQMGGDVKELIINETKKQITDRTNYQYLLFRSARSFAQDKNSLAQDILEQAVKDNAHIIIDKVRKTLEKTNQYRRREIMEQASLQIAEVFADMLDQRLEDK